MCTTELWRPNGALAEIWLCEYMHFQDCPVFTCLSDLIIHEGRRETFPFFQSMISVKEDYSSLTNHWRRGEDNGQRWSCFSLLPEFSPIRFLHPAWGKIMLQLSPGKNGRVVETRSVLHNEEGDQTNIICKTEVFVTEKRWHVPDWKWECFYQWSVTFQETQIISEFILYRRLTGDNYGN